MSKWFRRSTVTLAALALLFAVAFGIRLFSGNTEPVVSIQKESGGSAVRCADRGLFQGLPCAAGNGQSR